MLERTHPSICLLAALLFGCVGGDGGGGDGGSGGGVDAGAGGVGGGAGGMGGGAGGAGGGEPGQCAPGDPGNLIAIFDAVAAAGGGTPTEPNQQNCATACGILSSCLQMTCGVDDPIAVATSVAACLPACGDRDADAVGAVLGAVGMATCPGVDDRYCGQWFDPACSGGAGGAGGQGGMGGMGGQGGMGGMPDLSECDPDVWCPVTACVLDCDDEACARGCVDARCGPDGAACMGCPVGDARPICRWCTENGHPEVCECDLGVVCQVIACGAACGDDDTACRDACAEPCEPRAGHPCVCTEAEILSCVQ